MLKKECKKSTVLFEGLISRCFEKNKAPVLINLDALDDESLEKLVAIDTYISKLKVNKEPLMNS
ncbi:MAG: hypothetical protein GY694_13200 [Gammaproteobacteria bacterium]|nr:hypothetical protein [Gammaproteobacteria bacterium]